MPYTSADFEKVVRQSGLQPIARKHLGEQIYLYSAEGVKRSSEEMDEPHWLMLWAVGFDDKLQFGQKVFIPSHVTLPHSQITVATTRHDRVEVLEKQALELIQTAKDVEIFDAKRH